MRRRGAESADPIAGRDDAHACSIAASDDVGRRRHSSADLAMKARAGRYPGGKNGAGVYQKLISLIPPHRLFVEAFLGSGAILKRKRPAAQNIGIDIAAEVIDAFPRRPDLELITANAVDWIASREWDSSAFIYCDPPYLGTARASSDRGIYSHEMLSDRDHERLLEVITRVPAMVMLSGYGSVLYDRTLAGWRRIEFKAMTRGGLATEVVWMNYPEPTALHDYGFLGEDFHDRLRIRRKLSRWTAKLASLPPLERAAILEALGR